jgi:hypothetical protein
VTNRRQEFFTDFSVNCQGKNWRNNEATNYRIILENFTFFVQKFRQKQMYNMASVLQQQEEDKGSELEQKTASVGQANTCHCMDFIIHTIYVDWWSTETALHCSQLSVVRY